MSFNQEVESARACLVDRGADPDAFEFESEDCPPDMEVPGMFILRYDITARKLLGGQIGIARQYKGGIGLDWVERFREDLHRGVFDAEGLVPEG